MARITFVKDLKQGNQTLLQLLNSFVFGGKKIEKYDPSKTYNHGDFIVYENESGEIQILQCQENNVTGPFDISLWEVASVASVINGDKMFSFSDTKPTDKNNILWFKKIKEKTIEVDSSLLE